MKRFLTAILVIALFASSATFAKQVRTLQPRERVDVPSFLGYVPDAFIVILKDDVTIDHGKDFRSPVALSALQGFDALADQFSVSRIRPQFPGSDRGQATASDARRTLSRYYKVRFESGTLEDAMGAYEANPMVDHVEPIGIHTFSATPNDPFYDDPPPDYPHDQWHYWDTYGIDADLAWDANTGDATVVVGVLDSGVKYDHGDLGGSDPPGPNDNVTNGNIWVNSQEIPGNGVDDDANGYIDDVIGWDFVERTNWYVYKCIDPDCGTADNDPFDGDGHGTHVAGTIAAITNNGYCVAGVAGGYGDGSYYGTVANGVKVVPCRIGYTVKYRGQPVGAVIMDYVAEAMYYMASLKQSGENVVAVNCSFGSSNSGGLGAAVDYLLAQDVMVIVAAGNDNSSSPDYLGARDDCLDVGGTAQDGGPYSWSNYGPWVDLAAPAVDVMSTVTDPDDPTSDYIVYWNGTSMACPHVVGTAALLKSCDPTLTSQQIWNFLVSTTTPYSGTKDIGSGILNAKNALDAAGCGGSCDLVPDFSGAPTSGCAPLTVSFTDLSTGTNITSWYWEFGDGGTSTAQSPGYTFNVAGNYSVSLTVTNSECSRTAIKTDYISVQDVPVGAFSGTPNSGDAPLTVDFTDESSGNPTTWSWDFGDGGTSPNQNPSYTYSDTGHFTVTLTVSNGCGSDVEIKASYITVTEPQGGIMHVHDNIVTRKTAGPNCSGKCTIYIYDASDQPVSGAVVYVTATGPVGGTGSGTTLEDGSVAFETGKTRDCSGEWCFEVTNVTHASYTYDPSANRVTKACESGWVYSSDDAMAYHVMPDEFGLSQNYPNPFNPTTEISFTIPTATHVTLEVYNIIGQRVAILANDSFEAGRHAVTWDASGQSSGVYLYRLTASEKVETRKMILLK